MPGIIVFSRRWSVGSDDLIIPALALVILHTAWIVILAALLAVVEFNSEPALLVSDSGGHRQGSLDPHKQDSVADQGLIDHHKSGSNENQPLNDPLDSKSDGDPGGWNNQFESESGENQDINKHPNSKSENIQERINPQNAAPDGEISNPLDSESKNQPGGVNRHLVKPEGSQEWVIPRVKCSVSPLYHVVGFLVMFGVSVTVEGAGVWVSMRGTILNTEPRASMTYLIYVRLALLIAELVWQILAVVWVTQHYEACSTLTSIKALLGVIVCNWFVMLCVLLSIWCTFDAAGRSWVKMKRYQESLKGREPRASKRRYSGTSRRNWRQRKAMRLYEKSWDRRCQFLFCCVKSDEHQSSFSEVAKLFTDFFRDLDVVPSDILAGLMLLRKHQRLRRSYVISEGSNDVYKYLSGVAITPSTRFLDLNDEEALHNYERLTHYMTFALGAYGWPMYLVSTSGAPCRILSRLRCCCCRPRSCICCSGHSCCISETAADSSSRVKQLRLVGDNCCRCNFAALCRQTGLTEEQVVYANFHVDIGETPFYVAVDHTEKTVVIAIRGTLSLQDVLTDLKADAEIIPIDQIKEDWLAHKGMVQAAVYIRKQIKEEQLLSAAFCLDLERGTQNYDVVVVGHSLGAGTAAILTILLRQEYPNIHCYAFSPPGGLLSAACMEETKSFISTVVVGKDVVCRIGLHQLESLRQDLINVIKRSSEPKWKIIAGSMLCCSGGRQKGRASRDDGAVTDEGPEGSRPGCEAARTFEMDDLMRQEKETRYFQHPGDDQITLSSHIPLYPPGRIIQIVRTHPTDPACCFGGEEPEYKAILVDNRDFNEVLISPTMVNDHMPDKVLAAMRKLLLQTTTKQHQPQLQQLLSESSATAQATATSAAETPGGEASCTVSPSTFRSQAQSASEQWSLSGRGNSGGCWTFSSHALPSNSTPTTHFSMVSETEMYSGDNDPNNRDLELLTEDAISPIDTDHSANFTSQDVFLIDLPNTDISLPLEPNVLAFDYPVGQCHSSFKTSAESGRSQCNIIPSSISLLASGDTSDTVRDKCLDIEASPCSSVNDNDTNSLSWGPSHISDENDTTCNENKRDTDLENDRNESQNKPKPTMNANVDSDRNKEHREIDINDIRTDERTSRERKIGLKPESSHGVLSRNDLKGYQIIPSVKNKDCNDSPCLIAPDACSSNVPKYQIDRGRSSIGFNNANVSENDFRETNQDSNFQLERNKTNIPISSCNEKLVKTPTPKLSTSEVPSFCNPKGERKNYEVSLQGGQYHSYDSGFGLHCPDNDPFNGQVLYDDYLTRCSIVSCSSPSRSVPLDIDCKARAYFLAERSCEAGAATNKSSIEVQSSSRLVAADVASREIQNGSFEVPSSSREVSDGSSEMQVMPSGFQIQNKSCNVQGNNCNAGSAHVAAEGDHSVSNFKGCGPSSPSSSERNKTPSLYTDIVTYL